MLSSGLISRFGDISLGDRGFDRVEACLRVLGLLGLLIFLVDRAGDEGISLWTTFPRLNDGLSCSAIAFLILSSSAFDFAAAASPTAIYDLKSPSALLIVRFIWLI